MGSRMEEVDGRYMGQCQGIGRMSGDVRAFPVCRPGAQPSAWSVFLKWPYHGSP